MDRNGDDISRKYCHPLRRFSLIYQHFLVFYDHSSEVRTSRSHRPQNGAPPVVYGPNKPAFWKAPPSYERVNELETESNRFPNTIVRHVRCPTRNHCPSFVNLAYRVRHTAQIKSEHAPYLSKPKMHNFDECHHRRSEPVVTLTTCPRITKF